MNILKTVSAVALTLMVASASADLLYWQVGGAFGNELSGDKYNETINFAYATVKADGSLLYNYTSEGATAYWKLYATGYKKTDALNNTTSEPAYFGSFNSGSVSSFLVELWDGSDNRVGWQSYSASALANNIWKSDTPAASGGTPLTVTGVVPEPTSGLLLLLGMAGLALRRKRRA